MTTTEVNEGSRGYREGEEEQESGIVERRKDYLYCHFFTPLELFFYKTLRSKYPEMTVADILVCRDVFIRLTSIDEDCEYGDVVDRMQIWTLDTISQEDWVTFFIENKERLLSGYELNSYHISVEKYAEEHVKHLIRIEGLDKVGGYQLFPDKSSITEAIGLARGHGYIRYELYETNHNIDYWNPRSPNSRTVLVPNARVRLREDIYNTLKESIDEAAKTPAYVMKEALEKHEQELAALDRCITE